MKKISYLIFILLSNTILNAQTPIINMENPRNQEISGAYYKDIYGSLDQFVGVWKYENMATNTILELHLYKKLANNNGVFYEDTLYGEYKYIENNMLKINTLPNLNTSLSDVRNNSISGNSILLNGNAPKCTDCYLGQKRVAISLFDPIKEVSHTFTLKINETTPLIMRLYNTSDGITYPSNANTFDNLINGGVKVGVTIPLGWYDLVKQP